MNTNNTRRASRRSTASQLTPMTPPHVTADIVQQNFDAVGDPQEIVEHMTVLGFLRLIDHRWNLHDIRRFGDTVGNMAEALHLSYIQAIDRSLGILRMFPEPLLRRVYDNLAPQCGWPKIIDVETPELEDQKNKRDALKANERQMKALQQMADAAEDPEVLASITKMSSWLEKQAATLRSELPGGSTAGAV